MRVSHVAVWGKSILPSGSRVCSPTVVGGWLWKQEKEARAAETGC